jgi:ABC-type transport system involved in cytochrome c biogenesis permease subunit
VTLHNYRARTLAVIPIRIGLGIVWLVAARLTGLATAPALLAFAVGLLGITFAALNDPRARFLGGDTDPLPAPPDAVVAPLWRQALAATMPSTVGVSILAAIALVPQPTLAALLGGVSAGLGAAALISVWTVDPSLYIDPQTRAVYRR